MFVIQSVSRAERCLNNVEVTILTSTLLQAVCIFSTTLADQAISYSYLKINELYIFFPPHSPLWSSTAGEGRQGSKVFCLQRNNSTATVKCSALSVEGEHSAEEKAEASLAKQGTGKVLTGSKRCKMKTIFLKETAGGKLMASD